VLTLRRANERGHANFGWLDSHHTFSFGEYQDSQWMGFGALRVINEDRVEPGAGFATHGHRDMEIISYVLEGGLAHKDSLGTGSVIKPGEVQRMSAGNGIRHSEYNASNSERVHFLQIWILPDQQNIQPSYEQREYPQSERENALRLVASADGREGSLRIQQDANMYASLLKSGQTLRLPLASGRLGWVQVARGSVRVNGQLLNAGDGLGAKQESELLIEAQSDSELLSFDLPA
jgi:quercetin 2,3-dioxygenase